MEWNELCDTISFVAKKGYEVDVINGKLLLIKEREELQEFDNQEDLLSFVYGE